MKKTPTRKTFKTMKKEIEKNTRCKDFPFTWIRKINLSKTTTLQKVIYRFNVISIKIPVPFFTEIYKTVIKLIWKHKRSRIEKPILKVERQTNTAGGIIISITKECYCSG